MARPSQQTEKPPRSVHATLVSARGRGILITGAPGIGKSELALSLIDRGAQLVADDSPRLQQHDGQLWGLGRPGFEGKLHLQSIGMADIRKLYGEEAIAKQTVIRLIVHLDDCPQAIQGDRLLTGQWDRMAIASTPLPRLTLSPSRNINLALLVETAVQQKIPEN